MNILTNMSVWLTGEVQRAEGVKNVIRSMGAKKVLLSYLIY